MRFKNSQPNWYFLTIRTIIQADLRSVTMSDIKPFLCSTELILLFHLVLLAFGYKLQCIFDSKSIISFGLQVTNKTYHKFESSSVDITTAQSKPFY